MSALLLLVLGCAPVLDVGVDDGDTGDTGGGGADTADTAEAPAALPLCINELMPANDSAYVLDDGATPDWVELHNDGLEDVDLAGWTLASGELAPVDLGANGVLGRGDWLLLLADEGAGAGHLPFKLSSEGGVLELRAPDRQAERLVFGHVEDDWAVARHRDCCEGSACLEFVHAGTPGAENGG